MPSAPHVGLVGCGRWGRHILRDLRSLGCRVTVVARSEASRQRALSGGADELASDLDAVAATDGFVVATPTSTHAEIVEALLDRRVPIFVEKPLSNDLAAAERVAASGAELVFVMDKWRYHPGVLELAAIARGGELGEVLGLTTTRLGWDNTQSDVDALFHLAPHDLSIAQEILGSIPAPVCARAAVSDEGIHALTATLGTSPWMILEVSHSHPTKQRTVRLDCSGGFATFVGGYAEVVEIYRQPHVPGQDEPSELRPLDPTLPLELELRAFVEHLQGGPAPRTGAPEAVELVRALVELQRLATERS